VILLGEHAVVYGRHAIAAPISLAIQAKVGDADDGIHLLIPAWGVEERVDPARPTKDSMQESVTLILDRLGLKDRSMMIEVFPHIPRAMGLGGSAAVAVAVIRAVAEHYSLELDDEQVSDLAYESEKIAHGTPSGIDNTLATYGRFILFRRGEPPMRRDLEVPKPIPIVLGITGVESLTAVTVARVRGAWERNEALYERIFNEIDALALQAVEAIEAYDLAQLGELMNINQGLLNALQVSSPELEELAQIARNHGALGAKLTGGGGGGSMVALCPDNAAEVAAAIEQAGFMAISTTIG
jgi:hydroxymethylglutaryl-CoA reductase